MPQGVSFLNRREKRSEILRVRVTPSLREEIEQDVIDESQLLTISDWLFEAAAQRLEMKKAIRISKQTSGRRVRNS
jgi:hypothetical protein